MALSVVYKVRVLVSPLIVRIDSGTLKATNFSFGVFGYQCGFSYHWYIEKRLIHSLFLGIMEAIYGFSVFTSLLRVLNPYPHILTEMAK